MDRDKTIRALEDSLDNSETDERKMRLHYLLAKFYAMANDSDAFCHFWDSQDLLEYMGKEALIGFRNFYRYREKLNNLEFYIDYMIYKD